MAEKILLTEIGKNELEVELNHLINVERPQYLEDLKEARSQGDLSENADYDAARDRQAWVEGRIKQIEEQLQNAEIIKFEESKGGVLYVRDGSRVTIEELDTREISTYLIVGFVEADPLNGKLSNDTPLAKAIKDKKIGDICEVKVKKPYNVKILSIK